MQQQFPLVHPTPQSVPVQGLISTEIQQNSQQIPMQNTLVQPITHDSSFRSLQTDLYRNDFSKVQGIEVLTFKNAELEKTLGNQTIFATVGNLQVLYFEAYDRFILSLNDWKYPLLRRIPIVSSQQTLSGPMSYTLPFYDGFFTLTLSKISHLEALQNFENILLNNSKFTYRGHESCLTSIDSTRYANILPTTFSSVNTGQYTDYLPPAQDPAPISSFSNISTAQPMLINQPVTTQTLMSTPHLELLNAGPLTKGERVKRGFKMMGYKLTKGLASKGKYNINHYQVRDIEAIKRTTQLGAPLHMFPKMEVERWIMLSKEIANRLGYLPEGTEESGRLSPHDTTNRMRGFGSLDLGQGTANPLQTQLGISTIPEDTIHFAQGNSTLLQGGYDTTKLSTMQKLRGYLPGPQTFVEQSLATGQIIQTNPGIPYMGASSIPTQTTIIERTEFTGLADNAVEKPSLAQKVENFVDRHTNPRTTTSYPLVEPVNQPSVLQTTTQFVEPRHTTQQFTTYTPVQTTVLTNQPTLQQKVENFAEGHLPGYIATTPLGIVDQNTTSHPVTTKKSFKQKMENFAQRYLPGYSGTTPVGIVEQNTILSAGTVNEPSVQQRLENFAERQLPGYIGATPTGIVQQNTTLSTGTIVQPTIHQRIENFAERELPGYPATTTTGIIQQNTALNTDSIETHIPTIPSSTTNPSASVLRRTENRLENTRRTETVSGPLTSEVQHIPADQLHYQG